MPNYKIMKRARALNSCSQRLFSRASVRLSGSFRATGGRLAPAEATHVSVTEIISSVRLRGMPVAAPPQGPEDGSK